MRNQLLREKENFLLGLARVCILNATVLFLIVRYFFFYLNILFSFVQIMQILAG